MKLYIVIDKQNLYKIKEISTPIPSLLDKYNFFTLCLVDCTEEILLKKLINNNMRAVVLTMWLSDYLLQHISEDEYNDLEYRNNLRYDERVLNNLMYDVLTEKTYKNSTDNYYNYGIVINKVDEVKINSSIRYINNNLAKNGLLLDINIFIPTLLDLFVESIENTNKEELQKFREEDDIDLEDDFYMNVITEFILKASDFYPKEEIQEFIESRFSEDE